MISAENRNCKAAADFPFSAVGRNKLRRRAVPPASALLFYNFLPIDSAAPLFVRWSPGMIEFLFAAASGLVFAKSELVEFALDALGCVSFSF